MKKIIIFLCTAAFISGMAGPAFTGSVKLRAKRIKFKDLPQTQFEATRYKHVSGQFAIVLDDPNDKVQISIDDQKLLKVEEGLKTPEVYLDQFKQTPQVHKFYNKKDGTVYGYLIYAGRIDWLARIDKSGEDIEINALGRSDDFP